MKALITKIEYKGEKDTQFGINHSFIVEYDGKSAWYSSKTKDQTKFVEGKECEFDEEEKTSKAGKPYLQVKPIFYQSKYGKALQREQSKYSGFATSYVKDLIIADKIDIKDWETASKKIAKFMFDLDKELL